MIQEFRESVSNIKMVGRVWNVLQKLKIPERIENDYAILILNQPIMCERRIVKSLWNKAAFRMLVDGGTNRWMNFLQEQKMNHFEAPHAISGDFDSIKEGAKTYFKTKGIEFISTPDQDETDFTKALRHVSKQKDKNIKHVFVICENSGRLDQTIANINTLLRSPQILPEVDVFLLSGESLTWIIRPGTHTIIGLEECVANKYHCGLIPICGPAKVSTVGLRWNLDKHVMKMGELISTSNFYVKPEIHITCDQELLWTTEYCKEEN